MNDRKPTISRRTAIKITGTAGLTGLAGCTGGDGGDSTNNGSGDTSGSSDGGDNEEVEFPTEQIELIIPFAPGGGYDTYTRLVAPYLEEYLPNDVNVQPRNVEGADGQIATEEVYNAEPDGHTLELINLDNFSKKQVLQDVNFDITEMTYFAQVAAGVRGMALADHTGIETWDEFTEATRNGELTFGTNGRTGGPTMIPVVIGEVTGEFTASDVMDNMVVYDGTAPVVQGMLGGDVDVLANSLSSLIPQTESDGISPFLIATAGEVPDYAPDDIPTLTDMGVSEEDAQRVQGTLVSNRAFGGPPGIPDARANILEQAFADAINDEDFIAEAEEAGRPVVYADAEECAQVAKDKVETWGGLKDIIAPDE